jgi:serine/threonine-protein kinase
MAEDPLVTHARTRIGRTLRNKWTLDKLLGVGGMAAVYECTHRNGSKVAIKMLHPNLMFETNFAQRLVQEGYVANKINHPAAVKVYDDDTDETDGSVFLVMELLPGQTLSQYRRTKKRFNELETLKMLSPVLECLGNAHQHGIIHRDIKPENLFVQPDGQVRVLDFGIARVSDSSNVTATRTGMVVGSPAYMSPEQALGKMNSVGPQTDVYAVGATMFALISGTTPHAGESTQEMIVLVATQQARKLSAVFPEVNQRVAEVIDRALLYNIAERYPDAFAMLAEVREVIAELEGGKKPKVLPTFVDDEEEGATQVAPALKSSTGANSGQRPAVGAGQNRQGVAPPVGAEVPNSKMRQATMAPMGAPFRATTGGALPIGAPPIGAPPTRPASNPNLPATQAMEAFPVPDNGPPSRESIPGFASQHGQGPPGSTSGMQPFPGTNSGINFPPPDVGTSSGQRPGVNTNMAWAAPPTGDTPAPKARSNRVLFGALGALVLLGGGVALASGALSGNSTPTTPPVATHLAHRPTTPVVAPTPPVVAPTPPVVAPTPPVAAPPVAAEPTPPVAAPTPPTPAVDPAPAVVAAPTPAAPPAAAAANDDDHHHRPRRHGDPVAAPTPPAAHPAAAHPAAADPTAAPRTGRRRPRNGATAVPAVDPGGLGY